MCALPPIGIYLTHPRVLLSKRAHGRRNCAYSFKYRYKSEGLIDFILQGVMSVNLLLGSGSVTMMTIRKWELTSQAGGPRDRCVDVFLISLTRWDGQPVLLREGGGDDAGGGGSCGGSQWLLNQTMADRVPLVLSGIPLLPGESPQPLSVDGTASEVKGGVACVRVRVWTQQLVLVPPHHCRNQGTDPPSPRSSHLCLLSCECSAVKATPPPLNFEPKGSEWLLKSLLYRQQITLQTTCYSF